MNHLSCRTKISLLLLGCIGVACNSSNFASDGFKGVKFGMTSSQLTQIGFTCESEATKCKRSADSKSSTDESATLFGKPADIEVKLKNNAADVIDLRIGIEQGEMVKLYSDTLGMPQVFEYTGATGNKIRRHYWISSNNTSIAVTINLSEGPPQGIFKIIGPRSSAVYRSQSETKAMLEEIGKNTVKPKDL